MTRREWVLTLGAGLCGSMVPACTHAVVDSAAASPALPATPPAPHLEKPPPAANPNPAPFDLASPVQPPADGKDDRVQIKQVGTEGPAEANPALRTAHLKSEPTEPAPGDVVQPASAVPQPTRASAADESPLVSALRCFLDKRPDDAMSALGRYSKENQDLLLGLLPLTVRLSEGNGDPVGPKEAAVIVDQLETLSGRLRPRADLSIDQMCFCRRIETFGVYEPLPDSYRFRPGEWVHLYVEVRNFSSEKIGPVYRTRLDTSVEIRDDRNVQGLWQKIRRDKPDESRTLRHDYFDHCRFCLPENMQPGQYTLWIEVADLRTKRTARRSLDFRVSNITARSF